MAQNNAAAYIKEWRRTPAGKASLAAQKRREAAKRAAVKDLIEAHAAEYETLFTAHLQRIEAEARG